MKIEKKNCPPLIAQIKKNAQAVLSTIWETYASYRSGLGLAAWCLRNMVPLVSLYPQIFSGKQHFSFALAFVVAVANGRASSECKNIFERKCYDTLWLLSFSRFDEIIKYLKRYDIDGQTANPILAIYTVLQRSWCSLLHRSVELLEDSVEMKFQWSLMILNRLKDWNNAKY